MCKFVQFRAEYADSINRLYKRYMKYLEDDYNEDTLAGLINRTYPFFWAILTTSDNSIAGFVYLENIIGNSHKMHSAEITTCFHPKFWGDFSKYCAKIFLKNCFDKFGFSKIKALVYPENFRVKTLLKQSGFVKEAELKSETFRNGKAQDIEVYSLFKQYYEVEKNEI